MIYELRTTQVMPGTVARYEQRLEAVLAARQKHSPLGGCWHTELGHLLQVIELYPYQDEAHHRSVAEAVARDPACAVAADELLQRIDIELLTPAPFMRPLTGDSQKVGPVFELRIYQLKTGKVQDMIDTWAPLLPGRERYSPLLGAWHSAVGKWFHLWPYPDIASRFSTRAAAQKGGAWPPPTGPFLLSQESKILLPASFSPIQ